MEFKHNQSWLNRSWNDTLSFWGGARNIILSFIALPFVGFALHARRDGGIAMNEEFSVWLVYGLQAGGIIFLSVLFWNIVTSPFKQRDEARAALSDSESANVELMSPFALKAEITNLMYGGVSQTKFGGAGVLIFLDVTNVGEKQTACKNWSASVVLSNGEIIKGKMWELPTITTMFLNDGSSAQITGDKWVIEKALSPIQPGAFISGVLQLALDGIDELQANDKLVGAQFQVRFEDIKGNSYFCEKSLKGMDEGLSYHPAFNK